MKATAFHTMVAQTVWAQTGFAEWEWPENARQVLAETASKYTANTEENRQDTAKRIIKLIQESGNDGSR